MTTCETNDTGYAAPTQAELGWGTLGNLGGQSRPGQPPRMSKMVRTIVKVCMSHCFEHRAAPVWHLLALGKIVLHRLRHLPYREVYLGRS